MRRACKSFHQYPLYVSIFCHRFFPRGIFLLLLMGCFSLSGCAPSYSYSPAYKGDIVPDGKTVVYGVMKPSPDSHWLPCNALFKKSNSSHPVGSVRSKGEEFYLLLSPGDYSFYELTCNYGSSSQSWHIKGEFSVPNSGKAVYIGDIVLTRNGTYLEGKNVIDNYSAATSLLKDKYPKLLSNDPEKNLVIFKSNDL